jgi:eukaryotic-like serine/threonine-protein kinase
MIGTQIAHYRITAKLGQGGMGEVWQATDTTLGREVALKLLPGDFAIDPDRHARFEREAKVLAALNHPNIATLHGLEHAGDRHVLVMELVEGEDLSQRIARGPMPVDEVVPIALQIATALEAAHEKGVVHRDLKPANVKVRPDGTVKVLDFGLAKAWEAVEGAQMTHSPTITRANTAAGVILGTAAYMSPEQARGGAVDKRADIWAFGVVLWEMLSGRRLFQEETVSDTLAAVLREPVDPATLGGGVPRPLRRLLTRCLTRDPRKRLHDIADARLELEEALASREPEPAAAAEPVAAPRPTAWIAASVALGVAALALGFLAWRASSRAEPVVRAAIPAPQGTDFDLLDVSPGAVAVSPDGRRLVFAARDDKGTTLLWIRELSQIAARPLAGTAGAAYPFWSPDGRQVGFFAEAKLKKVDAGGGPPLTLCDAPNGKGGAWSARGEIVFAPTFASSLDRVPESGGDPTAVTTLDVNRGEVSHRHPRFLPDGVHFLYLARLAASGSEAEKNRVMVGSLDGGAPHELMRGYSNTEYASGYLLFVRDGTLMAERFDPKSLKLHGEAFPLAENVTTITGASLGVFSASANGVLAYQTGNQSNASTLVWRDGAGTSAGTLGDAAAYGEVHLSPDGAKAAVTITDPETGGSDVWIWDIARGLKTRFTFSPEDEGALVWSPDGRRLAFASQRGGNWNLFVKDVEGGSDESLLYKDDLAKYPVSWSPDGTRLVYLAFDRKQWDLWSVATRPGARASKLVATPFDEANADISPDGRWLAYGSDESGRDEVYVTSFPAGGRKWQVSVQGGNYPRWRRDGHELFYLAEQGALMVAEVDGRGATFGVGKVAKLFDVPPPGKGPGPYPYDVTADGKRFLLVDRRPPKALPPLTLVLNWPEGIGRR